jgi:hypothetical protein
MKVKKIMKMEKNKIVPANPVLFSDLIGAGLSTMRKIVMAGAKQSIWLSLYNKSKRGDNIIRAYDGPNELIIYPSSDPGYMILKEFQAPFADENYYKQFSIDDVLNELKNQIERGLYRIMRPAPLEKLLSTPLVREILQNSDNSNLKTLLNFCFSMYPKDFISSVLPEALKLKLYFSELIERLNNGKTSDDRKNAEDVLSWIFKAKTMKHHGAKNLPPHLYLNGLYEYLFKIAERNYDKRTASRETKRQMAKFFGYTRGSFRKELDEERNQLKDPKKAPKHLVYKVTVYSVYSPNK